MRTRRRPVLQDKTPGNTPQKPRASAKPKLVPVVEIKARLRRTGKGKQVDDGHQPSVDAVDAEERVHEPRETRATVQNPPPPVTRDRTRSSATARRGRGGKGATTSRKDTGRAPISEKEHAETLATATRNGVESNTTTTAAPDGGLPKVAGRKRTRAQAAEGVGGAGAAPSVDNALKPRKTRKVTHAAPTAPEPEPKVATRSNAKPQHGVEDAPRGLQPTAATDASVADHGASRAALRHISIPPSPTAGRNPPLVRKREPLGPAAVPSPHRDSTPDTIPIAEEDSSPSDAVKAIFDTPSPARIIRAPIPAQSTPMGGRLEQHFSPLPPMPTRGRHESSIRRWNHGVSRAYSPLPPSSPPPPTPPTQEPVAGSSRLQPLSQPQPEEENDYDMENEPPHGATYVRKERSSDDDPFGILAAERKVKALRQQRAKAESSRVRGVPRAPLGTLALDEVPSSDVPIPEHLPTPLPSDDDHNIDDLYLDVDPVPARMVLAEEHDDVEYEDEDKENVPTADYDLNEDKENLRPPQLFKNRQASLDLPLEDGASDSDAENGPLPDGGAPAIPPLLAASAKKGTGLAELFAPSSSSASPAHALRTPHKHRSAHKRSPLPTPNFSDAGFSDTPLTARSAGRRDSSPSPVKRARQPLVPIEVEVEVEVEVEEEAEEEEEGAPAKVAGQKRTRAQAAQSESDSDPRAAVRRLEDLLPKRSKARTTSTTAAARGRGRGRGRAGAGKGKARAAPVETEEEGSSESDAEESDSPPQAKKARTTRGTGRGRGRGVGRGRPRGRSAAPVSTRGRSTAPVSTSGRPTSKRGRSTSKGKGKERAEDIDPEEDEERARKREERLEYFRQLQEYSIEKEDVYVI